MAPRNDARVKALMAGPPITWLMTGDSITQAQNCTDGRRGYADLFAEHLRAGDGRLERVRDAVVNTGVAGSTIVDALAEFHWRVARFSPDVVSVLFGMNDCAAGPDGVGHFAFHLHQFVNRAMDLGAAVIVHTPYPLGPGGDPEHQSLPAYAQAIRDLAQQQGLPLVDHFAHWTAGGPHPRWYLDPWHANARGHVEMARLFVSTFAGDKSVGWLDELAEELQPAAAIG